MRGRNSSLISTLTIGLGLLFPLSAQSADISTIDDKLYYRGEFKCQDQGGSSHGLWNMYLLPTDAPNTYKAAITAEDIGGTARLQRSVDIATLEVSQSGKVAVVNAKSIIGPQYILEGDSYQFSKDRKTIKAVCSGQYNSSPFDGHDQKVAKVRGFYGDIQRYLVNSIERDRYQNIAASLPERPVSLRHIQLSESFQDAMNNGIRSIPSGKISPYLEHGGHFAKAGSFCFAQAYHAYPKFKTYLASSTLEAQSGILKHIAIEGGNESIYICSANTPGFKTASKIQYATLDTSDENKIKLVKALHEKYGAPDLIGNIGISKVNGVPQWIQKSSDNAQPGKENWTDKDIAEYVGSNTGMVWTYGKSEHCSQASGELKTCPQVVIYANLSGEVKRRERTLKALTVILFDVERSSVFEEINNRNRKEFDKQLGNLVTNIERWLFLENKAKHKMAF